MAAAQQALAGEPAAGLSPRRTQRVAAARIAEADELLEALSPGFQAPAGWRERAPPCAIKPPFRPRPVPAALAARLRPYQRLGVAWLWHLWRHELGGILADEMVFGKTIQALALLSVVGRVAVPAAASREGWVPNAPSGAGDVADRRIGATRPHLSLVIAPASLLEN